MADETIDLKSATPPEPEFNQHINALADKLKNITNDADFVNAIIRTPDEDLIPWEECVLPSKGLYYGWPDGVVKVKAMGQVAEKVLATQRLAQSGQSLDYLFKECCRFPGDFDPANLLLGDRTFLLYFLRGVTHGNEYEFSLTCPNTDCAVQSMHTYDLNQLASTVVWANEDLGSEPFKIVLPYLTKTTGRDVWVSLRYLRASDANDILNKRKTKRSQVAKPAKRNPFVKRRESETEYDDAVTENLEKVIVNVMGVTDYYTIKSFVERLHAQDTSTIRDWMKDNTPGIDSSIEISCPECGNDFTVDMPITADFFRPAKQRGL
jgi:hypothetical protein